MPSRDSEEQNAKNASPVVYRHLFFRALAVIVLVLCCTTVYEGVRAQKISQLLDSAQVEEVKAVTGDTLWSIAEQCCGNEMPTEDVVEWIRAHNNLSTAVIKPGQRICVPIVE